MFQPGGIPRPIAARERKWATRSGKANFIVPAQLFAGDVESFGREGALQLLTVSSNGQFNTTVYSDVDRFRGVRGTRKVVFMNEADMASRGLHADDLVDLTTAIDDGVVRQVKAFRVVPYNIPPGCAGAYFPEANPLVPLSHHDRKALTPAYKATPVRVARSESEA
jgi:anaerobic selenocysteine-containing dehydrogenase